MALTNDEKKILQKICIHLGAENIFEYMDALGASDEYALSEIERRVPELKQRYVDMLEMTQGEKVRVDEQREVMQANLDARIAELEADIELCDAV